MRKEVKLGMTIGAALIALLVGYLLIAPPSNRQRGAQLAGGNTPGGNDLAQPGDLATPDDRGEKPIVKQDTGAGQAVPKGDSAKPAETAKGDAAKSDAATAGKGGDNWNVLNTGKAGVRPSPPPEAKIDPKETKPIARTNETPARTETVRRTEPARFTDPHAAWGGGVSSDAVFGAPRSSSKTTLVSAKSERVAAEPVGGQTHVIKQGETFSSIAQAAYGSASLYTVIVKANPNVNPNALRPGTPIKLPALDEAKAARPSAGEPTTPVSHNPKIDATKQYKVKSGDSLYKIAVALYGKSSYVDKIYEKNKATIGADRTRLKLGMVLELPEKPSQLVDNAPAKANTTGPLTGGADSATPANNTTTTISDAPTTPVTGTEDPAK